MLLVSVAILAQNIWGFEAYFAKSAHVEGGRPVDVDVGARCLVRFGSYLALRRCVHLASATRRRACYGDCRHSVAPRMAFPLSCDDYGFIYDGSN